MGARMSADLLRRLIEAGTPADLIAEVAMLVGEVGALERRRKSDRERQANRRHVTSRDTTDVTLQPVTPSLEVSPENPLPKSIPSPPYKPPASQKRGTRLADDFEPPEDWIAWAMNKRSWSREEAVDECECFIRYWQAKPGREACKLDWPKTWQNWAVNSRRQAKAQGPPVAAWDGMA
jgi:hypothetical protein